MPCHSLLGVRRQFDTCHVERYFPSSPSEGLAGFLQFAKPCPKPHNASTILNGVVLKNIETLVVGPYFKFNA